MKAVSINVPGKWVLAGEHSVLRGGMAVAMSHPSLSLSLDFRPGPAGPLEITCNQDLGGETGAWIRRLLEETLGEGHIPSGNLHLTSSIPTGSGLGSSAALCVALTRWLAPQMKWSPADQLAIATQMEDHFHGKSSGMDVAACSAGSPIRFTRAGGAVPLKVERLHHFQFHDTGLRMATRQAVAQVAALQASQPALGRTLDARMSAAADLAARALESGDILAVAQAMQEAQSCFESWGLVPSQVSEQIRSLRAAGALAVKLTGAGGGGYLVSLKNPL